MDVWKVEEEIRRGIAVKDEEFQERKKSYLDFLDHLHFTPPQEPNEESAKPQRKHEQVKSYAEEQYQTERCKLQLKNERTCCSGIRPKTRKEDKQEKEQEIPDSKEFRSFHHECHCCANTDNELQLAREDRAKLENENSILKKKMEQLQEEGKEFAKIREDLAKVRAEKDLMAPIYNRIMDQIAPKAITKRAKRKHMLLINRYSENIRDFSLCEV